MHRGIRRVRVLGRDGGCTILHHEVLRHHGRTAILGDASANATDARIPRHHRWAFEIEQRQVEVEGARALTSGLFLGR